MTAWLVYAGILIYMELVFHLGSYGFQGYNPIFTIGVIALISALQALIGSCFSEKGEKTASRIMLWLQFTVFAVQAVYMHIFRQPLQLAAMFLGGQNALTNYWREALLGVLQTTPLLVLFALPVIVLEILRKKKIWQPHPWQSIQRLRLILLAWAALVYSVCSILIGGMVSADYAEQYREYYDPATVMQEMGVLVMVQRDGVYEIASLFDRIPKKPDNAMQVSAGATVAETPMPEESSGEESVTDDVTAGQEVNTADATEKENAEAEISEDTDETEIYVGFSDSEETE